MHLSFVSIQVSIEYKKNFSEQFLSVYVHCTFLIEKPILHYAFLEWGWVRKAELCLGHT